ncbi:MAG TPA: hypothetical protein PKC96_07425 [Bacilli bacterium]|nr:hypothetical protein [Bacilli bacterium]
MFNRLPRLNRQIKNENLERRQQNETHEENLRIRNTGISPGSIAFHYRIGGQQH